MTALIGIVVVTWLSTMASLIVLANVMDKAQKGIEDVKDMLTEMQETA